jgi:hypothetical protein
MLAQDQFVRDHIEAPDTPAVRAVNHPFLVGSRSDPKHDGRPAPPRVACDAACSHSPYILEHGGRDCCTLAKTKPTRDQAQDEHSRSGQQPQSALAAGWRWRCRRSCRGRGA